MKQYLLKSGRPTVEQFPPVKQIKYLKHRHQRCKAPSLCKILFITDICRLKEAGKNKYLSHNVFFFQRLSHNVFPNKSFSQRLSHVFFTTSFIHRCLYIFFHTRLNEVLTASQYRRNLSVLHKYPKYLRFV